MLYFSRLRLLTQQHCTHPIVERTLDLSAFVKSVPTRWTMNAQATPRPLIALLCVGLIYTLLGWHMSAYDWFWAIAIWLLAISFIPILMWGGGGVARMLTLGPQGCVTMLILSSIVTLAVAAYTLFAVILILLATKILARLELQAAGFSRSYTLGLLALVATMSYVSGWVVGKTIYETTPFWLSVHG